MFAKYTNYLKPLMQKYNPFNIAKAIYNKPAFEEEQGYLGHFPAAIQKTFLFTLWSGMMLLAFTGIPFITANLGFAANLFFAVNLGYSITSMLKKNPIGVVTTLGMTTLSVVMSMNFVLPAMLLNTLYLAISAAIFGYGVIYQEFLSPVPKEHATMADLVLKARVVANVPLLLKKVGLNILGKEDIFDILYQDALIVWDSLKNPLEKAKSAWDLFVRTSILLAAVSGSVIVLGSGVGLASHLLGFSAVTSGLMSAGAFALNGASAGISFLLSFSTLISALKITAVLTTIGLWAGYIATDIRHAKIEKNNRANAVDANTIHWSVWKSLAQLGLVMASVFTTTFALMPISILSLPLAICGSTLTAMLSAYTYKKLNNEQFERAPWMQVYDLFSDVIALVGFKIRSKTFIELYALIYAKKEAVIQKVGDVLEYEKEKVKKIKIERVIKKLKEQKVAVPQEPVNPLQNGLGEQNQQGRQRRLMQPEDHNKIMDAFEKAGLPLNPHDVVYVEERLGVVPEFPMQRPGEAIRRPVNPVNPVNGVAQMPQVNELTVLDYFKQAAKDDIEHLKVQAEEIKEKLEEAVVNLQYAIDDNIDPNKNIALQLYDHWLNPEPVLNNPHMQNFINNNAMVLGASALAIPMVFRPASQLVFNTISFAISPIIGIANYTLQGALYTVINPVNWLNLGVAYGGYKLINRQGAQPNRPVNFVNGSAFVSAFSLLTLPSVREMGYGVVKTAYNSHLVYTVPVAVLGFFNANRWSDLYHNHYPIRNVENGWSLNNWHNHYEQNFNTVIDITTLATAIHSIELILLQALGRESSSLLNINLLAGSALCLSDVLLNAKVDQNGNYLFKYDKAQSQSLQAFTALTLTYLALSTDAYASNLLALLGLPGVSTLFHKLQPQLRTINTPAFDFTYIASLLAFSVLACARIGNNLKPVLQLDGNFSQSYLLMLSFISLAVNAKSLYDTSDITFGYANMATQLGKEMVAQFDARKILNSGRGMMFEAAVITVAQAFSRAMYSARTANSYFISSVLLRGLILGKELVQNNAPLNQDQIRDLKYISVLSAACGLYNYPLEILGVLSQPALMASAVSVVIASHHNNPIMKSSPAWKIQLLVKLSMCSALIHYGYQYYKQFPGEQCGLADDEKTDDIAVNTIIGIQGGVSAAILVSLVPPALVVAQNVKNNVKHKYNHALMTLSNAKEQGTRLISDAVTQVKGKAFALFAHILPTKAINPAIVKEVFEEPNIDEHIEPDDEFAGNVQEAIQNPQAIAPLQDVEQAERAFDHHELWMDLRI